MIQHITVFAEVHICLLFGQPRTQGSQREPWVRGCFLTSFEQKVVWPLLVDFGSCFSNSIWLRACTRCQGPSVIGI